MLIELIKSNDTEAAKKLIRNSPETLNETANGMTAIMFAAYFKNADLLTFLKSLDREYNLFEASMLGDLDSIKKNIENDPSSVHRFAPDGFQALGYAAYFNLPEVVELLLDYIEDVNIPSRNPFMVCPLHSAVSSQSVPVVKMLLAKGANPNLPQQKGILPIHSAAHLGNIEIIKLLIDSGADLSMASEDGKTVRDYAADAENEREVLAVLPS